MSKIVRKGKTSNKLKNTSTRMSKPCVDRLEKVTKKVIEPKKSLDGELYKIDDNIILD